MMCRVTQCLHLVDFVVTMSVVGASASAASLDFVAPRNMGAVVNTSSSELGPSVSSDGLTLYFHSDRGGGVGGNDLWLATRSGLCEPFANPLPLSETVNSGAHEIGAEISPNGLELFFSSSRSGGSGNYDLYVARRDSVDAPFDAPANLGTTVNSVYSDFSPALSSDGLELYFQRSDDPGGAGGNDLWIARRASLSDAFGSASPLEGEVNSPGFEGGPDITDDGLALYFTSDRAGGRGGLDIWVATRSSPAASFGSAMNLSSVNSTASDFNSHIAIDGHYFQSNRGGGEGENDIWFAPYLQVVDPRYTPNVPSPRYPNGEGPLVLVDNGHENFATIDGRYQPWANLLRADGYQLMESPHILTDPDFSTLLNQAAVFVMPLAKTVVTENEVAVLVDWIENGGSLLLIFDHPPYSDAVLDLARALGVKILNDAFVVIPPALEPSISVFDRSAGDLKSHYVTDGGNLAEWINQVRTGAGYTFTDMTPIPAQARMEPVMVFGAQAYFQLNGRPQRPAAGTYQGAAISFGRGRVYAASDGSMFTAQIRYGCELGMQLPGDNEQFALNVLHWLDGHSTSLEISRAGASMVSLSWHGEAMDLWTTPNLSIPQWTNFSSARTNPVVVAAMPPESYFGLHSAQALLIKEQPQAQMAVAGDEVIFQVMAEGTGPLRFQWSSHWMAMIGETNSSLRLADVVPEQQGEFQVIVSDDFGSVTSAPASLIVEDLAPIPAGMFIMGSPANELERLNREGPLTEVTISEGFQMGRHEVTQREFVYVMGFNPSWFNGVKVTQDTGIYGLDLGRPVESVTWHEATNYCAKLTEMQRLAGRLPEGHVYRLPTEAEWEYACRAGSLTAFHFGPELRSGMANFDGTREYHASVGTITNEAGFHVGLTVEVGNYAPNGWGLYDMHGNVWEWCHDWYGDSLPGVPVTDPPGPPNGSGKVDRGGSHFFAARYCRSAYRGSFDPQSRSASVGFRIVLARPLP